MRLRPSVSVSGRYSWRQQVVLWSGGGEGFDGLSDHTAQAAHSRGCTSDRRVSAQCYGLRRDVSYHAGEAAHSRGCKADRRVSAQCYGLRRDGSKGRRSGGVHGLDGLFYHAAQVADSRRCRGGSSSSSSSSVSSSTSASSSTIEKMLSKVVLW